MTRPDQGLSSLALGGKMRDPGNEVGFSVLHHERRIVCSIWGYFQRRDSQDSGSPKSCLRQTCQENSQLPPGSRWLSTQVSLLAWYVQRSRIYTYVSDFHQKWTLLKMLQLLHAVLFRQFLSYREQPTFFLRCSMLKTFKFVETNHLVFYLNQWNV